MAVYAALFYIITGRNISSRYINMITETNYGRCASAMFCESVPGLLINIFK
jgi:hypothetical protein